MASYERIEMIKSFRGLMADGAIDTVLLGTNTGSTGYRIVKMDLMSSDPMDTATKAVVKIYKVPQTAVTNSMDFSDQTLLAAGYFTANNTTGSNTVNESIIFDREVFNQDIHITHDSGGSTQLMNYYIELEQVKLDLDENTVATLKDIRNVKTQGF
jgi:hypothetical protein